MTEESERTLSSTVHTAKIPTGLFLSVIYQARAAWKVFGNLLAARVFAYMRAQKYRTGGGSGIG